MTSVITIVITMFLITITATVASLAINIITSSRHDLPQHPTTVPSITNLPHCHHHNPQSSSDEESEAQRG